MNRALLKRAGWSWPFLDYINFLHKKASYKCSNFKAKILEMLFAKSKFMAKHIKYTYLR